MNPTGEKKSINLECLTTPAMLLLEPYLSTQARYGVLLIYCPQIPIRITSYYGPCFSPVPLQAP